MARKLVYEGSVKNLWEVDTGRLEFEYTDAFSVFDWGRMPDGLSFKGESLAAIGAHFFQRAQDVSTWKKLSTSRWIKALAAAPRFRELVETELAVLAREGLAHHFLERSGSNRLLVRKVAAIRPVEHKLAGYTLYQYTARDTANPVEGPGAKKVRLDRLVPLEVIFRFGMPKGSSLVERLTPDYARELGFSSVPKEGALFERPILEFFSKLEDTDRFLTWDQALNYSGVEFEVFRSIIGRTLCLACWLAETFGHQGLELWDGKFEWAVIDGKVALVDSIGPDELRLLDPRTGTQISKEFLRLFYRPTPWFEALKQAKKEAEIDSSIDWKELTIKRVGEPPRLSHGFKAAGDALYPSLALAITGENPGGAGLPLSQMLERIRGCLGA